MQNYLRFIKANLSTLYPRLSGITPWIGHIPFAQWLVRLANPRCIVELGVHKGDSYCAFCQAVKNYSLATKCFGVDTWKGDSHAGYYPDSILHELKRHHDLYYNMFSILIQSTFDAAVTSFADNSIDLLHIDGFHTYEAVRHDFETWFPKLSERAIVLFHDTAVRKSNFGVWKYWEEIRQKWPHFEFYHSHGLGVLGVGRHLPSDVLPLFSITAQEQTQIRKLFATAGRRLLPRALVIRLRGRISQLRGHWGAFSKSKKE